MGACGFFLVSSRLTLACGGIAMNAVDDLSADCLGHAGLIYEYTLVGVNFQPSVLPVDVFLLKVLWSWLCCVANSKVVKCPCPMQFGSVKT